MIQKQPFPSLKIGDAFPVRLMGIINLSPESFFKESYIPPESLLKEIKLDLNNGANFLDFGARSTAPWSDPISLEEEYRRVDQALQVTLPHVPKDIVISIDTQYAEIARLALKLANDHSLPLLINDISSFHTDPRMKDLIIEEQIPVCLMATQNKPGDCCTIKEILSALSHTVADLEAEGYDSDKIIIDPGIGKWVGNKTYEYDLEMLHSLHDLRAMNLPVLIGLSRKSFIGSVLNRKDPKERNYGSYAATAVAVYNGAHIIRAHQITPELHDVVQMASALRKQPVHLQSGSNHLTLCPPFNTPFAAKLFLKRLGVTPKGSEIMHHKMFTKVIALERVTAPQALILKQEMLARGGDVALHRDVITTEYEKHVKQFTVVLIGTLLQFQKLIQKLKSQDLELEQIGRDIDALITKDLTPKINFRASPEGV